MSAADLLLLWAATLPVFLLVDLAWLGFVARGFYRAQLGHLMAARVRWPVAIAFYLAYVAGVLLLAVEPTLAAGPLDAAVRGGLLGAFAYMTYDLTNLATLRGWPARLVPVDVAWGTVLTAIVAVAGHLLATGPLELA